MKKKIIVLLSLVVVMSSLLCGCGGTKSQITFSSGETLTAREVKKLDNTYGYLNDKVTIEMTVKEVDAQFEEINSSDGVEVNYNSYSSRDLSVENWSVGDDIIPTLQSGDRIRVKGRVDFIGTWQVTIEDVTDIQVIQ